MRQRIGLLFQNAALFDSISVGENVAFPMRRHTEASDAEIRERATHLLAQVGLERDYDKMPADLSGGMRKRAGLARALALEPAILLADEPSAGLDPVTAGGDRPAAGGSQGARRHDAGRRDAQHPERARSSATSWCSCTRGGSSPRATPRRSSGATCALVRQFMRVGRRGLTAEGTMDRKRGAWVGAFVVGGVLLFAVGLFLIGDRRLLFAEQFEIGATFGKVTGVQVGTRVRLAGLDAGEVLEIGVPSRPSEKFLVRMRIREDCAPGALRFGRSDSDRRPGGRGFMQLSVGTDDAPVVAPGVGPGRHRSDRVRRSDSGGPRHFRLVSREVPT